MKSIRRARLLAAISLPLWLGGCSESTRTVAPTPAPPAASSAAAVVRRLEWAVDHSDADVISGLLSADFELRSAEVDSAGNPGWAALERDSVMAGFRAMLDGVPGRFPPASARLSLDRNLIPFPDTRAGHDARVHRTVRTRCELRVDDVATGMVIEISGSLLLFSTRGDSAAIPPGPAAAADSLHWWIGRIDDETVGAAGTGASSHPATSWSLRRLLDFYRARLRP